MRAVHELVPLGTFVTIFSILTVIPGCMASRWRWNLCARFRRDVRRSGQFI